MSVMIKTAKCHLKQLAVGSPFHDSSRQIIYALGPAIARGLGPLLHRALKGGFAHRKKGAPLDARLALEAT